MLVVLGSTRPSKIQAVRDAAAKIAQVDPRWRDPEIVTLKVETTGPAMPLSHEELMRGARERAEKARELMLADKRAADFFLGLEGGFHSVEIYGRRQTFLLGWAYATNGKHGCFGAGPAILVPDSIAGDVIDRGRELGDVIDEFARQLDVRSRQGSWGILTSDLLTRATSFELALVAALAPFYNPMSYGAHQQT
jgi:inosine/xanthosine triphosphatase